MKLFRSKKRMLALIGGVSLSATTLFVTILSVTFKNKSDFTHYIFDGRTFNSKEEFNEYLKNNTTYNPKEIDHDFYMYDSNSYAIDSLHKITEDVEKKHKIEKFETYKNINENIIDSSNQLSDNVITNKNEEIIEVFKGRDSMAYKNKEEAINTYKDISKKYIINNLKGRENIEFSNQNDAINYYENILRKDLEKGEKTEKYNVSGIDMTQEQVLQWIGQTTEMKYEHNGFEWTETNIPDIKVGKNNSTI